MKKYEDKIKNMKISELKILENSRLRTEEDLSELMKSIKQVGVLQPIVIRGSDNVVIMGNRRLTACKKLGLSTIPAIIKSNLKNDTDLYMMNLSENIHRKDISTIEIGRFCSGFKSGKLTGTKLSIKEIAIRLGIPTKRVVTCINIFERLPKQFRKDVSFFGSKGNRGFGISEISMISILNINSSMKKLTDKEFSTIIDLVKNEKLHPREINVLGNLLASGMDVHEAIEKIYEFTYKQIGLVFNKKTLGKALAVSKTFSVQDYLKKLLNKEYKNFVMG